MSCIIRGQRALCEFASLKRWAASRNEQERHRPRLVVSNAGGLRFRRDESGATAIEYGLIAAGIAAAIILVVNTLGTNLNTTFSSISSQLK